jgi:hypothetical protein
LSFTMASALESDKVFVPLTCSLTHYPSPPLAGAPV